MIRSQTFPKLGLILALAQRRRKNVLRSLPAFVRNVFEREQQILWTGFCKCRQAAVTRLAYLVERVFAGEMH
ncbi:MAG TPA: hypothetical protein VIK39_08390, partial [Candidatus Angelobacter sp.]